MEPRPLERGNSLCVRDRNLDASRGKMNAAFTIEESAEPGYKLSLCPFVKHSYIIPRIVPIPMARVIARAILAAAPSHQVRLCACNCGRPVTGGKKSALPACRKRLERSRRSPRPIVTA